MRIIKREDLKDYKKNRQVIGKGERVERTPEPKNEQLDVFKKLTEAIQAIISKPVVTPQVTVHPEITVRPNVKVSIPEIKPAKGWNFKAKKINNVWNITAERVE